VTDKLSSLDPATAAILSDCLEGVEGVEGISPALLAAYLDGGLDERARARTAQRLAASPSDFLNAVAVVDYLASLAAETAPDDLVEALIARLSNASMRERPLPPVETFTLLAAASDSGTQAILCRSQSGIWTMEVFVAPDDADKGYLLLSVHPDHRATYEGRRARVFVTLGNQERVLAEETVQDCEVYADISLAGLDLHNRDAINVIFGPVVP
jgi:hypothetical protein